MRKKVLFFCVLILVSSIFVRGRDFLPIYESGKSWLWAEIDCMDETIVRYYVETVGSDTLVDGQKSKIVWTQVLDLKGEKLYDSFPRIYKEDDGRVSIYLSGIGEYRPLMDFNYETGDSIKFESDNDYPLTKDYYFVVTAVKTANVQGIDRRVMYFNHGRINLYYWIEGIGSPEDFYILSKSRANTYMRLLECYKDGESLYTNEDHQRISSVVHPEIDFENQQDVFYDLNGRPVSNPESGNIYIHNGKTIFYRD